jgi:hypothetical protein
MTFAIKKVVEDYNDYLWCCCYESNTTFFIGAYNQGTGSTAEAQNLYRYSTTTGTLDDAHLPYYYETIGHEATRPFYLNGTIYVLTEGLNLDNQQSETSGAFVINYSSRTKIATFPYCYLLIAQYFRSNGKYIVGWCDKYNSNTFKLYDCPPTGGKTLFATIGSNLQFFGSVEHNGNLLLCGSNIASNTGVIYLVEADGTVMKIFETSEQPGFNALTIYNNTVYALGATPALYKFDAINLTFNNIWKCSSQGVESGGMYSTTSANNKGGIIIPVAGDQFGEIYYLQDNLVYKIIKDSDFTGAKPNKTDLGASSGFITFSTNGYYIVYNVANSRLGPSSIYQLTGTFTGDEEVDGANTIDITLPSNTSTLDTLINDLDSQYQCSIDSYNSLNDEKTKLENQISLVTSLKKQYSGSYPDIATMLGYHLNQKSGTGGTYGLKDNLNSVKKMTKAAEKNLKITELLSRIYTAAKNGSNVPTIDADLLKDIKNSADDEDSAPDFIYKNREDFPDYQVDEDTGVKVEWPIGATCVKKGVLYVYTGVEWTVWKYHDNDTGWERVALQSSDEQITATGA